MFLSLSFVFKLDLAKSELEIYLSQHNSLKEQLLASRENVKKCSGTIDAKQR